MQTLSQIKALLGERGLRPRHRFGQNFLHDKNQLTKLVEAADVQPGDVVLEVGPGTGTLTEALLERDAQVIAVEIDRDLAAIIRDRLGDRITLIEGDALEGGRRLNGDIIRAIDNRPFKLVANLPYQIASPLMASLLIDRPPAPRRDAPRSAAVREAQGGCTGEFVTIQKEVADRLLASPSTKEYGPLTVIIRAFAEVKKIATLKPASFWPEPKVTSAMVSIIPIQSPLSDRAAFARFVTDLFSKRRKQLGSIFGREGTHHLLAADIPPDSRPEALSVDEIQRLWVALRSE